MIYLLELYFGAFVLLVVSIAFLIIKLCSNYGFAGPIAGAIIATGISVAFNWYSREKEKQNDKRALADALIAELTVMRAVIEDRRQQFIEQAESLYYFNIVEDYLTIFSHYAGKLGLFSQGVSADVIRVYIEIKGLIDSVRGFAEQTKAMTPIRESLYQMAATNMLETTEYKGIQAQHEQQLAHYKITGKWLSEQYVPQILKEIDQLLETLNSLKR